MTTLYLNILTMLFKGELPKHWTPMDKSSVYELVPLAATDKEYVDVSTEFQKTCKEQILKVRFEATLIFN